jgi:transcriptional regulator with XRE-family HTH domain
MDHTLKIAIIRSERKQWQIALDAGLSESRFSRIVSGRIVPSSTEKQRIAGVLGLNLEQLFEPSKQELNPA